MQHYFFTRIQKKFHEVSYSFETERENPHPKGENDVFIISSTYDVDGLYKAKGFVSADEITLAIEKIEREVQKILEDHRKEIMVREKFLPYSEKTVKPKING